MSSKRHQRRTRVRKTRLADTWIELRRTVGMFTDTKLDMTQIAQELFAIATKYGNQDRFLHEFTFLAKRTLAFLAPEEGWVAFQRLIQFVSVARFGRRQTEELAEMRQCLDKYRFIVK